MARCDKPRVDALRRLAHATVVLARRARRARRRQRRRIGAAAACAVTGRRRGAPRAEQHLEHRPRIDTLLQFVWRCAVTPAPLGSEPGLALGLALGLARGLARRGLLSCQLTQQRAHELELAAVAKERKVGRDADRLAVPAEQPRAEGMERLYLGRIDAAPGRQLCADSVRHLGRCLIGEGECQQPVRRHRARAQQVQHARDDDTRLARARSRQHRD